jgi:hypothetical protein
MQPTLTPEHGPKTRRNASHPVALEITVDAAGADLFLHLLSERDVRTTSRGRAHAAKATLPDGIAVQIPRQRNRIDRLTAAIAEYLNATVGVIAIRTDRGAILLQGEIKAENESALKTVLLELVRNPAPRERRLGPRPRQLTRRSVGDSVRRL